MPGGSREHCTSHRENVDDQDKLWWKLGGLLDHDPHRRARHLQGGRLRRGLGRSPVLPPRLRDPWDLLRRDRGQ